MSTLDVYSALKYRYVLADGLLKKIAKLDEAVVCVLRPRQTQFVQFEPIEEGIVVREDYYRFKGSNLYLVDYDLRDLWTAELPSSSDVFANPVSRVSGGLSCGSWESWQCLLSIKSGKLISKEFTK
jgi:hypothetical protein